jgi:hypothetical protein
MGHVRERRRVHSKTDGQSEGAGIAARADHQLQDSCRVPRPWGRTGDVGDKSKRNCIRTEFTYCSCLLLVSPGPEPL